MAENDRIVERLKRNIAPSHADCLEAADRIEELEGALRNLVFKSLASEHGVKVAHKAIQDGAAIDDLPEMMDHRVFEAWSILTEDQGNG